MSKFIPACWSRAEIQIATQVDVGGLEFGDPSADAVFDAVHQSVPLARISKTGGAEREEVQQSEVLTDLRQALSSNEPLLRFITGKAGTGKSHLVRWLHAKIPNNPTWHVVYIEKRNTSLRRVIEQILQGIDTPGAADLRHSLAHVASSLPTVPAAMLALLNQLHLLLAHDDAPVIATMSGDDLKYMREMTATLIAHPAFKEALSVGGGPIERITKLAMSGVSTDEDITEDDLTIRESDLRVGIGRFVDAEKKFQQCVRQLIGNDSLREACAAILSYYLPRAKAEVFTGRSSDLQVVFEEVRQELASQRKQLFLFIEDLVVLHGIETQLAQALTVPARSNLCQIRAVIAVTTGHLENYDTFAERGVQYTMDVDRASLDAEQLRAFVGRYLNAGRVGRKNLAAASSTGEPVPNGCKGCDFEARCHAAFGTTTEGHGLFPFNAAAVDKLIQLASPEGFDPRNILREVIRSPLEVAEDELRRPGSFPSSRFARALAPTRTTVPVEIRHALSERSRQHEQEVSLRAFYARTPPAVDDELRGISEVLAVPLTDLGPSDAPNETQPTPPRAPRQSPEEIDLWAAGGHLSARISLQIRTWILRAVAARMQAGPYGLPVRMDGSTARIGEVNLTLNHIVIDKAGGGGGSTPSGPTLRFTQNDGDGALLKGVLEAVSGNLAGRDGGRWFLRMQTRLADYEAEIAAVALRRSVEGTEEALRILGVLSSVDARPRSTPAEALAVLVQPRKPADLNLAIANFLQVNSQLREKALTMVRDRLTQRKSDGAPSVFDAAPVIQTLVAASLTKELSPSGATPEYLAKDLKGLHDRQRFTSSQMWREVAELLARVRRHVGDDEDFAKTCAQLDEFVQHAHAAGALPERNSKEAYEQARKKVTAEAFQTHRRIGRLYRSEPGPAQMWELLRDPRTELTVLADYWQLCDRLLSSYRVQETGQPVSDEVYDRGRLHNSLNTLAQALEG